MSPSKNTRSSKKMVGNETDEAVIRRVRELYDSGQPLFTKERMRDLSNQIAKIEATGKPGLVYVTDLQGGVVTLTVNGPQEFTEEQLNEFGLSYAWCNQRPKALLRYRGLNQLTQVGEGIFFTRPEDRLLPIGVSVVPPLHPFYPVSAKELGEKFRKTRKKWESSKECAELKALVKKTPLPPVHKIVGFCCGGMETSCKPKDTTDAESEWEGHFKSSIVQHSLMLTVYECLQKKQRGSGIAIRVIAQEPSYTETDTEVLRKVGITTVDDPQGWLEVDRDTLVFVIAPGVPVREIIADIATPAVMIWRKLEPVVPPGRQGSSRLCDGVSPRVREMIQGHYTEVDLIELNKGAPENGFSDKPAMYIRKV